MPYILEPDSDEAINRVFAPSIFIRVNGKSFKLINLPFYYVGRLEEILDNTQNSGR